MPVEDILKLKGAASAASRPTRPGKALMVKHDIDSLRVLQDGRMAGLLAFGEVLAALDLHQPYIERWPEADPAGEK